MYRDIFYPVWGITFKLIYNLAVIMDSQESEAITGLRRCFLIFEQRNGPKYTRMDEDAQPTLAPKGGCGGSIPFDQIMALSPLT